MDKKGASDLLWNVILVVLIVTIMVFLFSWMGDVSSGKLIRAQMDAKETAMLIDMARPGTVLQLNKDISLQNNNVIAKFNNIEFSYSVFNKAEIQSKGDIAEVKI